MAGTATITAKVMVKFIREPIKKRTKDSKDQYLGKVEVTFPALGTVIRPIGITVDAKSGKKELITNTLLDDMLVAHIRKAVDQLWDSDKCSGIQFDIDISTKDLSEPKLIDTTDQVEQKKKIESKMDFSTLIAKK